MSCYYKNIDHYYNIIYYHHRYRFHYHRNRYFGVWTALEPTDADNGPLRVLVGGIVW